MKRIFLLFLSAILCLTYVGAQSVKYPFQSMLSKGDYQDVKNELDKELKKTPNAVGLNYTAYKLYSDRFYKGYDLEKAYNHLARSWQSFKALKGKDRDIAVKNGLNDSLYKLNIEYICTVVYKKINVPGTTQEQFDSYLKVYKLAPESIRKDIASKRDNIRKNETGNSDMEMCTLLKTKPSGDWVEPAKNKLFQKAMSGSDLQLAECLVDVFTGEQQEQLLGKLHAMYVEKDLSKVNALYTKFASLNSPTLKMHKEIDDSMQSAIKESNGKATKELVNKLAPYNTGVVYMAEYADSLLHKAGWTEAQVQKEIDQFKLSYGGNQWYRNLMNTLMKTPEKGVQPVNLGSNVNTKRGSEYSPFIVANDSILYFVGKGRTDNLGGEDIYMSHRLPDGSWDRPERLSSINTAKGNEAVEALTVDGEEMIVFKNGKFFHTLKHGNSWGKLTTLNELNISQWQADAILTSDGNALLFSAITRTDREVEPSKNLYVSVLDSLGNWSKPVELGPTINSAYDERAPFLHPDMRTLYFSSNGHGSLGSNDIWMCHRKNDNSWTEWSEPVNLGRSINSAEDECWYKISTDGSKAYFSKTTPDAEQDLFDIKLPSNMKPDPVVIVKGKITDNSNAVLDCKIKWEDFETGKVIGSVRSNSTDGSYFIVLPIGKRYGYFVEKEGYYPTANSIDLRNQKTSKTVTNDIQMVSIEKMLNENAAVSLNNLFFDSGKADLLPESRFELDRVASLINSLKVKVEISGYTDNRGDKDANQLLSEKRARAVRDYLISRGCDYYTFKIIGYGEERPRATNETPEGRQLNRRVEFRLLK